MAKGGDGKNIWYILAFVLSWLSGIIVFFMAGGNKRLKMYAVEAIVLGVIGFVIEWLGILVVSDFGPLLIWLFGLWLGYSAWNDESSDFEIPWLTDFASKQAGYKPK